MTSASGALSGTRHARRPSRSSGGGRRQATALAGAERRRIDLLSGLTVLLLAAALLFGGASREHAIQLMTLELLSLPVIGLALWRLALEERLATLAAPLAIFLAIAAVPLIQLVPLPADVWSSLPGRAELADGMRLAGVQTNAAPISLAPFETIYDALALLIPAGIFLGAAAVGSAERRLLVGVVVIGATISLALGALQLAGGADSPLRFYPTTNEDSAVGVFANRNHLAALLVVTLPLLAIWTLELSRERRQRVLFAVVVGMALFSLVIVGVAITRSRAGLLLTVPALVASLVLMLRNARSGRVSQTVAGATLVTLATVAAVSVFALGPVLQRFSALGDEERAAVWPSVIDGAQHFAPVGAGIGTFEEAYRIGEPLELVSNTYLNHAHNDYLELWFEAGWLGLAVLGVFAVWVVWRSVAVWSQAAGRGQGLAQAASVVVILLALHSVVDYPLRTPAMAAVFALMCALLARQRPSASRESTP